MLLMRELFDKPVEWDIVDESANSFDATFSVGDSSFVYTAWGGKYIAKRLAVSLDVPEDSYEIAFYNTTSQSEEITGSGEAAIVFSTVVALTKYFLKEYAPLYFFFTSKTSEESRVRLYRLAASQAKRLFPGYTFENEIRVSKEVIYLFRSNEIASVVREAKEEPGPVIDRRKEILALEDRILDLKRGLEGASEADKKGIQQQIQDVENDIVNIKIEIEDIKASYDPEYEPKEIKRKGESFMNLQQLLELSRLDLRAWNTAQKDIWLELVRKGLVNKNDTKRFFSFGEFFAAWVEVNEGDPPTVEDVILNFDLA